MPKTYYYLGGIALLAAVIVLSLRFWPAPVEDGWLCVNGEWSKQGQPNTPAPTGGCGPERQDPEPGVQIDNFEDCAAAGYPVMESFPRQCRAGDQLFVEDINGPSAKKDLIVLEEPLPDAEIESPLFVKGRARGYWFFEATFPIVLTDWDGRIIAQGYATAQDEWMTEDFVPFEASLEFTAETGVSNRGALILQKDNPSGLPENDDALEIPVWFKK